jgi:hypothetical protein
MKTKRLDKLAVFRDLGYEPHPGQLAVHQSRASRRVLACGVRAGKTLCAAMEGLAAALEPADRSVGWVCAPTYDLADRVFREIQYHALRSLRHRIVSMKDHDRLIVLRNMGGGLSQIRAKSADNAVSLLGEGLDWVIIDEAARLRPHIWEQHLSQRLLDKRGWALMLSTPRGKGWYWTAWRLGQPGGDPDYESWNWPSRANPILDPELIERERKRLPERVFLQEYEAQFLEGAGQVFRFVREAATGEWKEPVQGAWYAAGLDLARVNDYTVLVIVDENRQLVHLDRFHKLDWTQQVGRIKTSLARYNDAFVGVDATGAGQPVYESLLEAGCNAEPYTLTASSKASLINNLALLLEERKIVLPRPELCPELVDEMEAFEYSISEAGAVRTGAPSGMNDDCVIALGLAMAEARDPGPVEVQFV